MKWYLHVIRNYANFKGRARRKEFWMFVLFNFIFSILASILDNMLGLNFQIDSGQEVNDIWMRSASGGYINSLYSLFILIPSLAVSVRRLHDINKSGKILILFYAVLILSVIAGITSAVLFSPLILVVVFLVMAIFGILLLVWMCTDGTPGTNKYGPNPKSNEGDLEQFGGVFVD
jgi:uncharacterized membrane protein YhaH (DUF805 family)